VLAACRAGDPPDLPAGGGEMAHHPGLHVAFPEPLFPSFPRQPPRLVPGPERSGSWVPAQPESEERGSARPESRPGGTTSIDPLQVGILHCVVDRRVDAHRPDNERSQRRLGMSRTSRFGLGNQLGGGKDGDASVDQRPCGGQDIFPGSHTTIVLHGHRCLKALLGSGARSQNGFSPSACRRCETGPGTDVEHGGPVCNK
jgi:hypothetical protein